MAPSNFASDRLSDEELISHHRDWKLKLLQQEVNFSFDQSNVKKYKEPLNFIFENFRNEVVSGSLALNLYGLVHRQWNDLDILIDDKSKYSGYIKSIYGDLEFSPPNRLGYLNFKWKSNILSTERVYEVDFFLDSSPHFIELDFGFFNKKLKIHHPVDIINYKLKLALNSQASYESRAKHNRDLTYIFGQTAWQLALKGAWSI